MVYSLPINQFSNGKTMSRKCAINAAKGVLSGNNVSHSNRRTRRRFLPNLQMFSFRSEALKQVIKLKLSPSTVRSIEHNDGIDGYLLKTSSLKLTDVAKKLKKKIKNAVALLKAA
jgi:large subunit ribosomal protein L28